MMELFEEHGGDFIVMAGVYIAETPLYLCREFAKWANGAQLLAAGQSFIDNIFGMNLILELMLAELKKAYPKKKDNQTAYAGCGDCAAESGGLQAI